MDESNSGFTPKSVVILGRQPALGLSELESLYGADVLQPFGAQTCLLSIGHDAVDFSRLGGSVRLGRILTQLPSSRWQDIEAYLLETTPKHAEYIEGKLSVGLSVYGVKVKSNAVARTALLIKKVIKNAGHSVRMVPHKDTTLGTATVIHNKLTSANGWELLIISDGITTYLAQTAAVQDIEAYTARDQARPYRDAKVGMLPPKLAQIIINIAARDKETSALHILDPFCGTGVVLQEAVLMGMFAYGSDIDDRMVDYTKKNIQWLHATFKHNGRTLLIEKADATIHHWQDAHVFDAVACETFLGKPLSALPPSDQLQKIMHEANQINHRFLNNIAPQLRAGTRLCVAVPTWRGKHEFLHLSALDHLTDMGYTRLKFKHVSNEDLIYHREGQVVARELVVLVKD